MRCPAKVNLFLKVTGKRPDGYHMLETLFLPFDGVADSLTLADGPAGVRCTVAGAELPDNLVCRAAEASGVIRWTNAASMRWNSTGS